MESKRIVLLTLDFPPVRGGVSRYLIEIVRHWPSHRLRVISLPAPNWQIHDRCQDFEIQRICLPLGWKYLKVQLRLLAPIYIWHLLKKRDMAFIICGQAHHSLLLASWLVGKITGVKHGTIAHGLDLLEPQKRFYRVLFNALLRASSLVVATNRASAAIAAEIGVSSDKLAVVYPMISVDYQVDQADLERFRDRLRLQGKRCILTVGRLVERKGHDKVILAMPGVLKVVPEAHYLIVGSGEREGPLRSLVSELGLSDYVTFAGHLPDQILPVVYELCEVFVMISRDLPEKGDVEGFGIVFLEANLHGKPVVAGRSGGVPEAVLHGQTGLLVDPLNVDAVRKAIVQIMTDPKLAKSLGECGRQRVLDEFQSVNNAQKLLSLLDQKVFATRDSK